MNTYTGTSTEPQIADCLLHQPGLGFDQNGHQSTLGEMIQMDGFLPVDEIIDRLPFKARTLRKWSKKGVRRYPVCVTHTYRRTSPGMNAPIFWGRQPSCWPEGFPGKKGIRVG